MLSANDLDTLFFCSFRYALGRRTYIVHDIATLILENKDRIHKVTIAKMIEEILGAIATGSAGHKEDTTIWHNLAILLETYLQGDCYAVA